MTQITEETFEKTLQSFIRSDQIDLRGVSFIDPYGMVGLLEIGELCMLEDIKKTILLPRSAEVQRYLERMDFFASARRYFSLEPMHVPSPAAAGKTADSDVLLEITPIERANDIHYIVGKVEERAQAILAKHLRYDSRAINGFIVALSEICQNIVEHSENKGFVGIQKYRFPSLGKNIVKIAVMDAGIGFSKSLSTGSSSKAIWRRSRRPCSTERHVTRTRAGGTAWPLSGGSPSSGRAGFPSARARQGSRSFPNGRGEKNAS